MNFKFQSPFKNIQYGIICKKVKLSQIYSIIVKSYEAFKHKLRKVFKIENFCDSVSGPRTSPGHNK